MIVDRSRSAYCRIDDVELEVEANETRGILFNVRHLRHETQVSFFLSKDEVKELGVFLLEETDE